MTKRFWAILLTLCLVMSMVPATTFAQVVTSGTLASSTNDDAAADDSEAAAGDTEAASEAEETGDATNPYTVENLGVVINLPSTLTVTNEEATEEKVTLTIAMDGRTDVGFSIVLAYNDAYEGYTMSDLPEEMKTEMIQYYQKNYPGNSAPTFPDAVDLENASQEEVFQALFSPFTAFGTGADGNLYAIYVSILNGYTLTVSAGIAAKEFDADSFGACYNLYFQASDMFFEFLSSLGAFDE